MTGNRRNGNGDPIHLFVGAAPKYAPSRVMRILKSISAREIFKGFPELRKQLWGGEFWSDGGYIGTVGDGISSEIIKRYIKISKNKAVNKKKLRLNN